MLETVKISNTPDIKFYFNPEPDLFSLGVEAVKIDFKDLSLARQVTNGTILIEKSSSEKTSTKGKTIETTDPSRAEEDAHLILGKNVKWDEKCVQATADGIPVLNGRKVEVRTVYEIRGDVNRKTGNISFDGDILIKGDVLNGLSVEATGNIFVLGDIDGGYLCADGDVLIDGGIIGGGKSRITCRSLYAGYINNANIEASQDVKVQDAILNSQVNAGHKVIVTGEKGSIYGGKVKAGVLIEARYFGSKVGTATELEVGSKPDFQLKIEDLDHSLGEVETALSMFKANLESLDQQSQKLTPEQERNKEAFAGKIQRYKGIHQSLVRQKNELLYEIKEFWIETGYLKVYQRIFPGVKVKIGTAVSLFKHMVPNEVLVSWHKGEIAYWEKGSGRLRHNR